MIVDQDELERWGRRIGASVATPVFLGLRGPLGAGKSVLARAVGRGAGVDEPMASPTFNLMFRYDAEDEREVVHMDLYRLQSPDELWELGWHELGVNDEIVLVEWPERAGDRLPPDRWEITLSTPAPDVELEGPRQLFRRVEVSRFGRPPHLPGFPVSVAR